MKQIFIILSTTILLTACAHKPPKPHGKFFPINPNIESTQTK